MTPAELTRIQEAQRRQAAEQQRWAEEEQRASQQPGFLEGFWKRLEEDRRRRGIGVPPPVPGPQRTDPRTGKPVPAATINPADQPGSESPLWTPPDQADRQGIGALEGDRQRMMEEAERNREIEKALKQAEAEKEYQRKYEEEIMKRREMLQSLIGEREEVPYPMPDKAQEAERMKYLSQAQIFGGMMEAAGGDFAGIGKGFMRGADKYEEGYARYQAALQGKAEWDQQNADRRYKDNAALGIGAIESVDGTRAKQSERQYEERKSEAEYQRDLLREGMKQRADIIKEFMTKEIDPSLDPEGYAQQQQLKEMWMKEQGIVLPRRVPRKPE